MSIHKTAAGPWSCPDLDALAMFLGAGNNTNTSGRNRYHCSYVIYKIGTYYYAENGSTGKIDYGGPSDEGLAVGTNATAVIQGAINNAVALGSGTIFIKKGTYGITATLLMYSNIELIGEEGAVLQKTVDAAYNIITYMASASDTSIINLTFDGQDLNTGDLVSFLPGTTVHTRVKILHNKFMNSPRNAIYMPNANNCEVCWNYFTAITTGYIMLGSHANDCRGNKVIGNELAGDGTGYGIAIATALGGTGDVCYNVISKNLVYNMLTYGIDIEAEQVGTNLYRNEISDNQCYDNGDQGIILMGNCYDNLIVSNICRSNGEQGIETTVSNGDTPSRNIYSENNCSLNGRCGIRVRGNFNIVSENISRSNSKKFGELGSWNGITIVDGDYNVVIGNTCFWDEGDVSQSDGIRLVNANYCLVANNLCYDNVSFGIDLYDAVNYCFVTGNLTHGNGTRGGYVRTAACNENAILKNRFLERNFLDNGTNTILQTREWLVTYGTGGISLVGDVPVAAITNGQSAAIGFETPSDLLQLVRANLKVLPNATQAAADWDLDSDYGGVGEAPNAHSEADAATTYNVTNNQWYDIELVALGFFANLAIRDRGGIRLTVSTAGHNVSVFSLLFEYV